MDAQKIEIINKDDRKIFMIDVGDMTAEETSKFIQEVIKKYKEIKGV